MFRFSTAAIACTLALSSTASFAASQSSASITGLTFTLIDLKPRDNIAPSFSFVSNKGSTVFSISANDGSLGESESSAKTRVGTFTFSKDYLAELTNAGAQGSLESSGLSVGGHAFGSQTSYSASASTGSSSNYYYNQSLNLTLSANTLLLINANVDLSASATNPQACTSYYYYCPYYGASESASASASMLLSYNYSTSGGSTSYNTNQSFSLQASARGSYQSYSSVYNPYTGWYDYGYYTVPGTEETKSLNDVMSAVFTNSTSLTQSAALYLSVSANGSGSTAPIVSLPMTMQAVPETDATAMGLAGLGLVGLFMRRRRQG